MDHDTFKFIVPPFSTHYFDNQTKYLIFDSEQYKQTIHNIAVIDTKTIKNYDLFGTEVMQSTVETIKKDKITQSSQVSNYAGATIKSPKIMETIFIGILEQEHGL